MKKLLRLFISVILLQIVILYHNGYSQWVATAGINGHFVECFVQKGTTIFVGTGNNGGVYRTTNDGTNWTAVNSGLSNLEVTSLAVLGQNIFAGTFGGGICISTNDGANWTQVINGITDMNVYSLKVNGTNIYAGTMTGGAFVSSNNGIVWTAINNGLTNLWVMDFAFSGTNMFAATWGGGVFLSTNGGGSWTAVNNGLPVILFISCLEVTGSRIIAGTQYGVYVTTNNGSSWALMGTQSFDVLSLAVSGNNVFAGLQWSGVYYTNNFGATWIEKNEGFPAIPDVYVLLIANNYIFSNYYHSGNSGPVHRRVFSEIIGIQNISTEIPAGFSLGQNYPNPFNPKTKIKFEIPKSGMTTIKVFDVSGKEISTLVNEILNAGVYETDFDGTGLQSGVYFYRIEAGEFMDTKKMMMVK